jgi:Vitamin K-dependent gamma-carboxylase
MNRTEAADLVGTSKSPSRWRQVVGRWFEIDVRSLAALRIGMALIMLWDLASRSTELVKFFADRGLAPRSLFQPEQFAWLRSVYFISGQTWFVASMFALHAVFALMLLAGFRTLLATVGCIVMYWSLINRNVLTSHSGDGLLVWMLIWSLFLPLGAAASVDRVTSGSGPKLVRSFASAAMLLQVVFVYLGAVISKTAPEWRREFSAVYFFLSSQVSTPLGHAVAKYTFLCVLLTISTMILELLGPPSALVLAAFPRLRTTIVAIFMFFHVCLGATLYVGTFAYICVIAWFPYMPAQTWDVIQQTQIGQVAARAWQALIEAIAGAIQKVSSRAVVRTIRWPSGTIATTLLVELFAYVWFVNVRVNLPDSITRHFGPLNLLPQAKQTWGVMPAPPHKSTRLALKAHLADRSTVTLVESGAKWPETLSVYLWPPCTVRELKYRQEAMSAVYTGSPQYVAGLCAYYQREWDAAHPAAQRVVFIDASCASEDTMPMELAQPREGGSSEQVIYSWKPPSH